MIGAQLAPATPLAPYNLRPQGNVMPPLAPVQRTDRISIPAIVQENLAKQQLGQATDAAFNTYYNNLKKNPAEIAKFMPSQVNTGINGIGAGLPLTAQELESRQKAAVRTHFDVHVAPEHPDLAVPQQNAQDATEARKQGVPVATIRNQRIEAAARAHDLAAPPMVPGTTRVTTGPKGTTSTTEYKPPAAPKEETALQRAQRLKIEATTPGVLDEVGGAVKAGAELIGKGISGAVGMAQNQAKIDETIRHNKAVEGTAKPPPGAMTDAGYANAMRGIDAEVAAQAATSAKPMTDQEKAALKQKLMQERLPASRLPTTRATSVAPDYTGNNATAGSPAAAQAAPAGGAAGAPATAQAEPPPAHESPTKAPAGTTITGPAGTFTATATLNGVVWKRQ